MNPFISTQAAKQDESSTGYKESSTRYKESSTRHKESSTRYKESSTRHKESSTRHKKPSTNLKDPSAEKILASILEQEQLCLEQVIQLLKTENKAIVERDIESMGHILDKKLPLLSKLEQLDKQRQQFFEQQTELSYHPSVFSRFIEQHASKTVQTIWHTVKEKLPECKTQNELNGRMINIKKNNTEQILQILLGHSVNSTPTYSHLGQTDMRKRSALYTAV